ncbi:protein cornichon homolog 4-like isoform X1 [Cannabis sativa]|uniref:protein cornichon homolog 4-like isoform X1 n=1 Tax=Cannabis sativa TaxID=3483 RepID=UPI0029CA0062|nr:protein cornichon homolog 4-like isoform X1 [Cannabis sativa]
MGDLYVWLISFFILIALLILIVYQLMCLADLEFDYINPYDSSARVNRVILPEFITQGLLCVFFFLSGHWVMSLLCGPYLYYNVQLYARKQHLVDVTEIFNMLHKEKKQRLFKLFYLIIQLFLCIFWYCDREKLCLLLQKNHVSNDMIYCDTNYLPLCNMLQDDPNCTRRS